VWSLDGATIVPLVEGGSMQDSRFRMPRRPALLRRGVVTLAVLCLLGVGFVMTPQPALAATGLRTFVSVDVTFMSRLLREETEFCGPPEYLVKTDVGMFEQPRVASREHEYGNPSLYEAWSFNADHYVDVAGEVTTFISPDYSAQEWISGRVNVVEADDGDCGGPDDQIDVNPQPGDDPAQLQFIIEPSTGRVFAYNYRDPLWILGWISERPTGGTCRFASGKTCYGNIEVRAPGGWIRMTIMLAALA
jgi:hypothetical protein